MWNHGLFLGDSTGKWHISLVFTFYWPKKVSWPYLHIKGIGKCSSTMCPQQIEIFNKYLINIRYLINKVLLGLRKWMLRKVRRWWSWSHSMIFWLCLLSSLLSYSGYILQACHIHGFVPSCQVLCWAKVSSGLKEMHRHAHLGEDR